MGRGEEALERLMSGNRRYARSKMTHPGQAADRRESLVSGQHPFAIVLGCSDSRIPPEIIFDQGLGDIFVVRVAGNIVDDTVTGSIEYAAGHLEVQLLLVLGHSRCGAVNAAMTEDGREGCIPGILAAIGPAVERARGMPGDLAENAEKIHVRMTAEHLRETGPLLSGLVEEGRLLVVAAYYDLASGAVEILPQAAMKHE